MARSRPTAEDDGKTTKKKAAKEVTPNSGVQKSKRLPRGSQRDWSQYSHNLPGQTELAKNGRQTGRNLIAWTRPRMAEKLLLHIEYEALLHNRPIPWDAVAHRFNPGSSGDAITQRLARMRKELIAEGHLVPPMPQKAGGPVEDVAVRGLIRAKPDQVDDAFTTRQVLWTEPVDHLKKPLGNAVYAFHGKNKNEGGSPEDDFDEDEDVNDLDQKISASVHASGSSAVQSNKGKATARPARPARSTVQAFSYAEEEDDIFDAGLARESDDDDEYDEDEDEDEGKDKGRGGRNHSQTHSRVSRIQHAARSQNRVLRGLGHARGLHAEIHPAFDHMTDFNHPYGAMTPGPHGQSTNHMSPYNMTPTGMRWHHGPMGLQMMPMGTGMGMDMMGGLNTTPTRSSAFTTLASSPTAFDVEDASPRSAAYFQAHLDEYNTPTPRGHVDFNSLASTPMGMRSMNAPTMFGNSMMSRNTTAPDKGTVPDNSVAAGKGTVPGKGTVSGTGNVPGNSNTTGKGITSSHPALKHGDPDLPSLAIEDDVLFPDSFPAEFSSMFSDSEIAANPFRNTDVTK